MVECKHKTLKALYYRKLNKDTKTQDWIKIVNFKVCQECGMIFKVKYERGYKR